MGYSTVTETTVAIITTGDVRRTAKVGRVPEEGYYRAGMVTVTDSEGNRVFLTSNAVRQLALLLAEVE